MRVDGPRGPHEPPVPHRAVILIYSAACHFLLFVMVMRSPVQPAGLPLQLRVLTILSFSVSLLSNIVNARTALTYFLFFRTAFITLAIALFEGSRLEFEVLLLMPFILETANRNSGVIEFFILALTLSFAAVFDCLRLLPSGLAAALLHSATILIISASVLLVTILLSRGRRSLLEAREQVRRLKDAINNLSSANRDFQNYAELSKSQSADEERNRITRDMHDLVGYALTNIIMLMNAARIFLSESPARLAEAGEIVSQTRSQADAALRESRRILYQLRSEPGGGPVGLQALASLAKAFSETTHIRVDFFYGNLPMSYGEWIDSAIYHVVQEGLTNAIKHGRADRITISLWETNTEIAISVRDNGAGADKVQEGIGLRGMKERLSQFGGSITAHGENYGFVLIARIPLESVREIKDHDYGPD
jgi:signal transduction histidine kinase